MQEKGAYVFYGSGGICQVSDIQRAPLEGMPKDKLYYVLKPVYDTGEVMYVPVESDRVYLRPIMGRDAALAFLSSLEEIAPIAAADSKQLRAAYAECMSSHEPREWVRVIKTVESRRGIGRRARISETERIYLESARHYLISEISLSLGCTEGEASEKLETVFE